MADLTTVDALPQLTNEVVLSKIESQLSHRLKLKWFEEQDSLEGEDNFSRMWQFLQKERKTALAFVRQRKEEQQEKSDSKPSKDVKPTRGAAHATKSKSGSSNSGQGTSTSTRKISESDRCFLHPDGNHYSRQCLKFLAMSVDERGKAVQDNRACKFCLSSIGTYSHKLDSVS